MNTISKILCAILAGIVMLWIGGATPAEATQSEVCYEQIEQAQYKKYTAPTDDGPWVLYGTWWKGQADTWHSDVGEVAEGPGNHPAGRYTYRRVAQRVVNGEEIPCETTTTTTEPEEETTTTTIPDEETTTTSTVPEEETTTTLPPRCPPEARFPQSYEPNAPCGPIDPCVGVDPVTGKGTTLWHVAPCEVPPHHCYPVRPCVPDIVYEAPGGGAKTLPDTGNETWAFAIAGLAAVSLGGVARRVARR